MEARGLIDEGGEMPSVMRRRPWSTFALVLSTAMFAATVLPALGSSFGFDFGVFRSGAELIASEGWASAYDGERSTQHLGTNYYPYVLEGEPLTRFISTPPFALFAQVFTIGPFWLALAVWQLAGLGALVAGRRVLKVPPAMAVAWAVSPMMAANVWLGQTGAIALLIFAAIHRAYVDQQEQAFGVFLGLMILKPTLAVGYGMLCLLRLRTHRTGLVVACAAAVGLSAPTFASGFSSWKGFLGAITARAEVESAWAQQSVSIAESMKFLAPNGATSLTVVSWTAGLVATGLVIAAAYRIFGDDPEMISAAAVVATVVGSPHLLIYDLLILAVPVAVVWKRGLVRAGDRIGVLSCCLVVPFAFGPAATRWQISQFGRGLSLELVGLLVAVALVVRWYRADESVAAVSPDIGEYASRRS